MACRNPLVCAQRAMAVHLMHKYTILRTLFPDPNDKATWNTTPLFPGPKDPTRNITYQQQYQSIKSALTNSNIAIKKVTHAFRVGGARRMDELGIDDSVSLG
jgi:hypothetical protein